ncbi:MAG: hypothetical protein F6K22_27135 [Okeania sp. SIO2F4]|uniref:hypothetical protein n=1 Tax=Okeania sp. SIO2F4 TaxID=2607790 RepID=UPI00142A4DA1|nr:hypothetical protein [Okeania sp. SIO2F4]NES06157.1 hypothetical protein [Okeania sp. SIO2F4]
MKRIFACATSVQQGTLHATSVHINLLLFVAYCINFIKQVSSRTKLNLTVELGNREGLTMNRKGF